MCMGEGATDIESLVVDGVELIDQMLQFNWSCSSSEKPIVKVQVRASGSNVILEECTTEEELSSNETPSKLT